MELTDERLVELFQQGDQQAFDQIVQRHEQKVFNIAFRLTGNRQDASDLTQEALFKVYRYLGQFRSQATFSTWLYRIVTNTFYDEVRKQKRRPQVAVSLDETIETTDGQIVRELAATERSPEEAVMQAELREQVQQALLRLPEDYRVALVLRDLQAYSYEEIAQILSLNLGTVKSRISRARLAFRQLLLQHEEQIGEHWRQMD